MPDEAPRRRKKRHGRKKSLNRSRRNFLRVGWASLAAAFGIFTYWTGRFFYPNVIFELPSVFNAGLPRDYAPDDVSTLWKDRWRVWIVREENKIYGIYALCTHLGCTPNWVPNQRKFKCPCHGSGYHIDGVNYEGPAPRPMDHVKIWLNDRGEIMVDINVLFRQEEWEHADAHIIV